ncbi:MAG: prephenate dehydratase [Acetobacter sp.]|nr:prephenate dehydratase [Bacteroides sp.]MCM1340225.1 prephenate dehydratase [Acetobacter sp.]MCM1432823.1 prephenate dehydratase [Clostridiales bacterium]
MDLLGLRKEIDEIDEQLIPLLIKRMGISEKVAQYKVERGLPVLNAEREQQILDNVAQKCGDQGETIKTVFAATMDASRALQHKIIGGGKELRDSIKTSFGDENLSAKGGCVACQGVDGAYSGVTANKLFPDADIKFYKQFEDVFEAVNKGEAQYGVIPVENSTAGSVHESYDLIMKYRFYVVGAYDLKIEHCLCAKADTKYEDVHEIYSHPQALSQCNSFIKNFDFTGVNYTNTAAAAKYVSESKRTDIAVICSESAAKKYGLKILKRNVQNNNNNRTRFIVISKKLVITNDADKISLIFTCAHKTGSLYRVLGRFSMAGLSLTKIESRPIENDADFNYYFYVDVLGNVKDESTLDLICALSDELPEFEFLGNFKEYI